MDSNWILPNKIKQEEPLEYFLISSTTDEELNLTFEKNSNSNNEHLEEIAFIEVKGEVFEPIEPDADSDTEPVGHSVYIKDEFAKETREYKPDIKYEPDSKYEPDYEYKDNSPDEVSSDKKKTKRKPQKKTNSKGPPYTCTICSLTFPIKKSLKAHQSYHKGKTVQCDICNGMYRNRARIREHMKIHFEKQFSCPICSKTYALKKSLVHHQLIHEERKFECDYCSKRFRQKGHIMEHMKMHRERTKDIQCQICDLAFYEQRTLNRHMKYIHSTTLRKRFRCPNTLCDKSYSSVGAFKMHACVDGRRPQNYLKIICTLCDKRFYNNCELERHIKGAHVRKPDNYECTKCKKIFLYRNYESYVLHMAQECTKPSYNCDYCSQTISSKVKLIQHFIKRHNIADIPNTLSCPHCVEVFASQLYLDLHLNKNHIESKCNKCNKTCRSKGGLTLHRNKCMREKTLKIENVQCDICMLTFRYRRQLIRHFRVGDHRTTLQCEFCHKIFKRISACKTHMIYCKLNPKKGLQV